MNDDTLDSVQIKIVDEIKNLINKRKDIYKSASVITILSKDKDSWRNVFTKITLSDKDTVFSKKVEYSNFVVNKISININDFFIMLNDLVNDKKLKIMNCPEVQITGTFEEDNYWHNLPSNEEFFKNKWPANNYIFHPEHQYSVPLPKGPILSVDFPHFLDVYSAMKYYTDIDARNFLGRIFILLPNYQVKIDQLTIGSEHIDFKFIINGIKQEELIGKLYCEKEKLIKTEDFLIDENPKKIDVGFIPDIISFYLLKKDGEIQDFRRIYLNWPSSPSNDVIIAVKEGEVLTMIKQGENQHIEFKKELNNKDKGEFVESVVAFANGKGGAILIGVDDNSNIIGFYPDKIEEQIINMVRSRCDPFIEPEIKVVKIDEKPIIVVTINEGENKPYTLRDKGVYVRSGSTDRIASRIELDEFYEEKKTNKFTAI